MYIIIIIYEKKHYKASQIHLQPDPIEFDNQIFDLAFHPSENIVATGLITGEVFWYLLKNEKKNEKKPLFILTFLYLVIDMQLIIQMKI